MATNHLAKSKATRDLPALLAKVRTAAEINIKNGTHPAAIVCFRTRSI